MYKVKVVATDISKRYKLKIRELGRIANPGEIFEVTRERYLILTGANQYKAVFVKKYVEPEEPKEVIEEIEEPKIIEEVKEEPKPAPKKRGRKKKVDGAENKE